MNRLGFRVKKPVAGQPEKTWRLVASSGALSERSGLFSAEVPGHAAAAAAAVLGVCLSLSPPSSTARNPKDTQRHQITPYSLHLTSILRIYTVVCTEWKIKVITQCFILNNKLR